MAKLAKEYRCWRRMIDRCFDESHHRYPWYGGRGITVCQRWFDSYAKFREDMGPAPTPDHSIDRIDNDGDYEPDNCRWATWKEQAQNRRTSKHVTMGRETLTIAEWASRKKMDRRVLWKRLNLFGWPVNRAINTPVAKRTKQATVLPFPAPKEKKRAA